MIIRWRAIFPFLILFFSYVPTAKALSTEEFINICHVYEGECRDHPVLRAYIGGALDLLATLSERTDHLKTLYCKKPKVLFDVPLIIQFIEEQGANHSDENAMWVLLKYFEAHGGC